jgi:hypothetical protein
LSYFDFVGLLKPVTVLRRRLLYILLVSSTLNLEAIGFLDSVKIDSLPLNFVLIFITERSSSLGVCEGLSVIGPEILLLSSASFDMLLLSESYIFEAAVHELRDSFLSC